MVPRAPPNQDDLALVGDQPDAVGHDLLEAGRDRGWA
jgi:hypothetical protein